MKRYKFYRLYSRKSNEPEMYFMIETKTSGISKPANSRKTMTQPTDGDIAEPIIRTPKIKP